MAVGKDKERIYVTVSSDMAKRIDHYCQAMGLSRSAFCSYSVGQTVMSMDKAFGVVDEIGASLREEVEAAE